MKILICGLPGAGKTTFARFLAEHLRCTHFNADDIRENVNKDLGFSLEDRIEQARRMGYLCSIVGRWGEPVIADFVCPTQDTRKAFGADFVVWMNTIKQGRFEDTNKLFERPEHCDYRVDDFSMQMVYHVREIEKRLPPQLARVESKVLAWAK